jgi:hypothetical protein
VAEHRTGPDGTTVPGTVPGTVPTEAVPSGTTGGPGDGRASPDRDRAPTGTRHAGRPAQTGGGGRGGAVLDVRDVVDLIPAAPAAHAALTATGRRLSRDALADRMRDNGYGVSNARACFLVKILQAENGVTALRPLRPTTQAALPGRP